MSELNNQNMVTSILQTGKTSGFTIHQISTSSNLEEKIVEKIVEHLNKQGKIVKTGRGLWILEKYLDLSNDDCFKSYDEYLSDLEDDSPKTKFSKFSQPITFKANHSKKFHSWSPYVQGFSSEFVDHIIEKYHLDQNSYIIDPFVGTGTTSVSAKLKNVNSIGIEMMPLMSFMSDVKTHWKFSLIPKLKTHQKTLLEKIKKTNPAELPFLKRTDSHFSGSVLNNLLKIKQFILDLQEKNDPCLPFFKLALGSILIRSSRLTRSPSLGYPKKEKIVSSNDPYIFYVEKISQIISDLMWAQKNMKNITESQIINDDSRKIKEYGHKIDMAVTSPPYINGMDYVINYKIENVWLDFAKTYGELKELKDKMVVCDNVSKSLFRSYTPQYKADPWLDEISESLQKRIEEKGNYRRNDMHNLVRKYFDDIFPVLENVYNNLKPGGKFHIVIGDSLIAGIYVPADLLIGRMGVNIGYKFEEVMIARTRYSGQRHDFKLHESIVVLRK